MFRLVFVPILVAGSGPYSGAAGRTDVTVPRLAEAGVVVDGRLSEDVWAQAAALTGFSEYSPAAIRCGVPAFASHGPVHATLANRDRIANDDWIEILLDTFDDHRQALVFGANPLGVQSDGTLNETQAGSRDTVDRSADFVYQTKGRVTDFGYEVEIRIPFKSLRYQPRDAQQWSLNIVRAVQHSGHLQTWTAARRAAASF